MMYDFHWTKTNITGDHEKRDEMIRNETHLLVEYFHILLSSLIRLGVIEETLSGRTDLRQSTNVPKFHMIKGPTELTDLGYYFVRNCKEGGKEPNQALNSDG